MDEALVALENSIAELKRLLQPGVTVRWPEITAYVSLMVFAKSVLESQETSEAYDLMLKKVACLVDEKKYQREFLSLLDSDAKGVFKSYLASDSAEQRVQNNFLPDPLSSNAVRWTFRCR